MAYADLHSPSTWRHFFDRHPNAILWVIAACQGVAMLGIAVVLRALAS